LIWLISFVLTVETFKGSLQISASEEADQVKITSFLNIYHKNSAEDKTEDDKQFSLQTFLQNNKNTQSFVLKNFKLL
jgi:hypothetical protein